MMKSYMFLVTEHTDRSWCGVATENHTECRNLPLGAGLGTGYSGLVFLWLGSNLWDNIRHHHSDMYPNDSTVHNNGLINRKYGVQPRRSLTYCYSSSIKRRVTNRGVIAFRRTLLFLPHRSYRRSSSQLCSLDDIIWIFYPFLINRYPVQMIHRTIYMSAEDG
jgi:hypothetical protein